MRQPTVYVSSYGSFAPVFMMVSTLALPTCVPTDARDGPSAAGDARDAAETMSSVRAGTGGGGSSANASANGHGGIAPRAGHGGANHDGLVPARMGGTPARTDGDAEADPPSNAAENSCGDAKAEAEAEAGAGPEADAETEGDAAADSETGSSGVIDAEQLFAVECELASQASHADPNTPGTVAIVKWSLAARIREAHIDFGLDTGYGMAAPVDLNEPDLRTLLLGMKPSRTYHFRIVASDGLKTYMSGDHVLRTGPATELVKVDSFRPEDGSLRPRGFIVMSYWSGPGNDVAFILDADGEIVWWYKSPVNGGIARARMSQDGKNMWMISASNVGAPLARVTMDTLNQETYGDTVGSHDLTPATGETMAFLDYGGGPCASICEIDPSGARLRVFDSANSLSLDGDGGSQCHANALRYSQKRDVYTFSDLYHDLLVVNREGGVDWRLSDRVRGGTSAWGGAQHGHQLLESSVVIFANRITNDRSAVIEYGLDGREIFRYDGGNFSAHLGDVQRLPGGNTLVTYSDQSILQQIDSQGNRVLLIRGAENTRIGYTLWQPSLYGPLGD